MLANFASRQRVVAAPVVVVAGRYNQDSYQYTSDRVVCTDSAWDLSETLPEPVLERYTPGVEPIAGCIERRLDMPCFPLAVRVEVHQMVALDRQQQG